MKFFKNYLWLNMTLLRLKKWVYIIINNNDTFLNKLENIICTNLLVSVSKFDFSYNIDNS
jgi:hypothetical protein